MTGIRTVGLTGGIGSGKSIVAGIFRCIGVPVFNADLEARLLTDRDPEIRAAIVALFGPDVYSDGSLNRPRVAGIVFRNPSMLARLNEIIHPGVARSFLAWTESHRAQPYVIHEAAILIESGFYRGMDTCILVTAPEELRISRVMQRDQCTSGEVVQRMKNQWPDETKIPLAGYVVINDGKRPVLPQIFEIHHQLTKN